VLNNFIPDSSEFHHKTIPFQHVLISFRSNKSEGFCYQHTSTHDNTTSKLG